MSLRFWSGWQTGIQFAAAIRMVALVLSCAACNAAGRSDDFADVRISLQRSACYGTCPDYKVTIFGNGRVVFSTEYRAIDPVSGLHRQYSASVGVLLSGTNESRISHEAVADLIHQFESAHFSQLRDQYRALITDNPTYVLTFESEEGKKSVLDYVGKEAGMPEAVTQLEKAVDKSAGTERWVRGNAESITWLEAQKFDFRSPAAAELVVRGAEQQADEAFALAFLAKGVPLEAKVGRQPEPAGQQLMEATFYRGFGELFRKLAGLGWLDRMGKDEAGQEFAAHAGGCSAELVDAAAEEGVNIDQPERKSTGRENEGRTALGNLSNSYACRHDEARRMATAQRLLVRNADPNHRDRGGRTSIYGVENLDLLNLLLSHGAVAKLKDYKGQSMIFGTWTDEIVLRLLQAGASPVGRYDYGNMTLPEMVKARKMVKVAEWLKKNPSAMKQ